MGVDVQRDREVAVVRLRGGRANAMSVTLLEELEGAFTDLLHAPDAAAVVVTGEGNAFSAGLALPALVALDRGAMRDFIAKFERVMQRVLAFPRCAGARGGDSERAGGSRGVAGFVVRARGAAAAAGDRGADLEEVSNSPPR